MRVTFDTNGLHDVISPETSQSGANGTENGTEVRAAIETGRVQSFFARRWLRWREFKIKTAATSWAAPDRKAG